MKNRIIKAGSIAFGITTFMGIINFVLGTLFKEILGIFKELAQRWNQVSVWVCFYKVTKGYGKFDIE